MDTKSDKLLGAVALIIAVGCIATTLAMSFIERSRKPGRLLFDQGAVQGASVILQSQGQGVTNMDVHVFLDAAWFLHTNQGGVE